MSQVQGASRGRPLGNHLDEDSLCALHHRWQIMHALRLSPPRTGLSERTEERARAGDRIEEHALKCLERAYCIRLCFAEQESDHQVDRPSKVASVDHGESLKDFKDPQYAFDIAESHFLASEYYQASAWYKRSHDLFASDDIARAALSKIKLANCGLFLSRLGPVNTLLSEAIIVLKSTKSGEESMLADAYEARGILSLINRDLGGAEKDFQQTFIIADKNHATIAGNAQYNLARVQQEKKHLSLSLELSNSALILYEAGRSPIGIANCLLTGGIVEIMINRFGVATEQLMMAVNLYAQANNLQGQAICHEILGDISHCEGKSQEAIDHRAKAWKLYCKGNPGCANEPLGGTDAIRIRSYEKWLFENYGPLPLILSTWTGFLITSAARLIAKYTLHHAQILHEDAPFEMLIPTRPANWHPDYHR